MTDISKMIIPKSDQLNADDLITGPRTITVTGVRGNEDPQQPLSIFFDGDNGKPYKPALSMRRVLVRVWGDEGDAYVGRSMTLYLDPEVKFGGVKVGGIRISHMSHIEQPVKMMLTTTRSKRAEYTVRPMSQDPTENALVMAKEAAGNGKDAFTEFWNSDYGKANRKKLKPHMDKLQAMVTEAENKPPTVAERMEQARQAQKPEDGAPDAPESPQEAEE